MQASGDTYDIEIKLRGVGQLFKTLDPSPLLERDLDADIEQYILDWVEDAPPGADLRLLVHAPQAAGATPSPEEVREAVHNNFAYRAERERRRLRALLRQGRQALVAGIAFLVLCSFLAHTAGQVFGQPYASILGEGLLILGWVANWRPVEIFLYDWRPARHRMKRFELLARMKVELRLAT